jgi:hypothetical protein
VNTDETARVLVLFESAWPTRFEVADYTAHVWAEATRGITGDVGLDAARRLVLTEDWPPTIARFRDECAAVVLDAMPEHVEPDVETDPAGSRWGAVSRGLREAQQLIPKHDHHRGALNCPACSTAEAREPAVRAALLAEIDVTAAERLPVPTGQVQRRPRAGSFYDPNCTCDHGWVTVAPAYAAGVVEGGRDLATELAALQARAAEVEQFDSDDETLEADLYAYAERRRQVLMWETAVYPCPDCRRTMYDRWRAGCYRRNHHRKSCKVCGPDAIKKLEADKATAPAGESF